LIVGPPNSPTRLLLLSGSQRRDSYNTRLLQHLKPRLQLQSTVDVLAASEVDLPLFDQDLECEPAVQTRLAALHARVAACHGLVISSPEYNALPSPFLKNLIDWVSRLPHIDARFNNPFVDRPLLLCSASTGWSGGALGLPAARTLFACVGCVVVGDSICVPHAHQAWLQAPDGSAAYEFDPFFEDQIDAALARLLHLARARCRSAASGATTSEMSHPCPTC